MPDLLGDEKMICKRILAQNGLDNFTYLLKGRKGKVICIDPIYSQELVDAINEFGGKLDLIINTHAHPDHISGNHLLVEQFSSTVLAHPKALDHLYAKEKMPLADNQIIDIDGQNILHVIYTPGHSPDSICLLHAEGDQQLALFTGDTLFNAGVGNCHFGDPKQLYHSLSHLLDIISPQVVICPGHDYMDRNLSFAASIDTQNPIYQQLMGEAELVDFQMEYKINLFLRTSEPEVQQLFDSNDSLQTFIKLRELRNNW